MDDISLTRSQIPFNIQDMALENILLPAPRDSACTKVHSVKERFHHAHPCVPHFLLLLHNSLVYIYTFI
eukprot:c26423_g1_i1 orf=78-284(+)